MLDFTNYKQIKTFIFKKDFFKLKMKNVQNFDFLHFSQNLGGKTGIELSRKSILNWYHINKFKIYYPWTGDLSSKRLINILYNYEYIISSSNNLESKNINKIIITHMHRSIYDFKYKRIDEITSYDLIGSTLSYFILGKKNKIDINFLIKVIKNNIDNLGVHKSYNILEHVKFLNNLNELKNIFLYFNYRVSEKLDEILLKMTSILNEYFHKDGSIPLFNGANNNYNKVIYTAINKNEYLKSRDFSNTKNGLAFYSDKNLKLFFDVVQPNKYKVSEGLSAGTLSFELSCINEKLITNCGASESSGKNPEYLRYSAAHSTIILQNTNISEIRENTNHIKFPQSVTFEANKLDKKIILEGSHNGYQKKFGKIIKRKIELIVNENKIIGEDSIISSKNTVERTIFHIRFHLVDGVSFNFTNNKKNVILKTRNNNMWLFKSKNSLVVEDSILVDNNKTVTTKQIVIKGITNNIKEINKWSLEKI